MDGDDDLLKNFFAEIDKLPTPSVETPADKKEVVLCVRCVYDKDDIVKTTGFVECSDRNARMCVLNYSNCVTAQSSCPEKVESGRCIHSSSVLFFFFISS